MVQDVAQSWQNHVSHGYESEFSIVNSLAAGMKELITITALQPPS